MSTRPMRRYLAALATSLIALAACGGNGSDSQNEGDTMPLTLVSYGTASFSWMTEFAADKGVFERNGIDVTLEPVKTSTVASAALASDSVDISLASPMSQLPAMVKGEDLTMISGETGNPFAFVAAADKNSGERWPTWVEDFSDAKIGVSSIGSGGYFFTKLMFKEAGISDNDVEYISCGSGPECNVALETGRIDAVMTSQPYVGDLVNKGAGTVLLNMIHELDPAEGYPQELVDVAGATYIGSFAKTDWVEANPELVERYQLSMMEAACVVNSDDHRKEFAEFVKGLGAVPASVADDELVEFVYDALRFSAAAPIEDARAWSKFVVDLGGLEDAPEAASWNHPGIAQSDEEAIQRVEEAGGSCSV